MESKAPLDMLENVKFLFQSWKYVFNSNEIKKFIIIIFFNFRYFSLQSSPLIKILIFLLYFFSKAKRIKI
jgi:hypothetical protein